MKQKILFIHHGKGLGGAPLSLLYLIKALDRSQYDPVVLFLYDSTIIDLYKYHKIKTYGPVNVMDFPHTKIWWLRWYHFHNIARSWVDTIKTVLCIAPRILNEIKPDIIHLNTSSLIAWGYAAHKKGIPVAWHIREPLADGYLGFRRFIVKRCVSEYSNAIIPICKNDSLPWKNLQKTHIVYNTVDKNIFDYQTESASFCKQFSIDSSRPTVLFLGGLSEEKGTHIILSAFKILIKKLPEAQLLIAGNIDLLLQKVNSCVCSELIEGFERSCPSISSEQTQSRKFSYFTAAAQIKSLFPAARFTNNVWTLVQELGSVVKLLGPITNVPAAMAASSIVTFPATVGHFARPIIEAGFMKKPVIASNKIPLNELVIHNKTGFLIDPSDHSAWADTMFLLLNDKTRNTLMGEEAYAFCTRMFDLNNHIQKIQAIYERISKKEMNS